MNDSKALAKVDDRRDITTIGADELANEIRVMFPDDVKSFDQALTVARTAIAYGLDPFMDELIPYQGRPYVTLMGMVRIAGRYPEYDGFDYDLASEGECKALGAVAGEVIFKALVYRKDRGRPVKMYGRAGGPNESNTLVNGKNKANRVFIQPADQAIKRAVHKALRASFPKQMPQELVEGITAAQNRMLHAIDNDAGVTDDQRHHELREVFDVESSAELTKEQATAYIDGRLVDQETGEIIDAEAHPATPIDTKPAPPRWHEKLAQNLNNAGIGPSQRDKLLDDLLGHHALTALSKGECARVTEYLDSIGNRDVTQAAQQTALTK